MTEAAPIVFVVDDTLAVREAVTSLLGSVGLRVQTFGSARDFLGHPRPDAPACLVLDVRLPGLSGLDLQRELADIGSTIPIVFISGHADIPISVQAMKAGATEFLTKPFRDQQLLDAVQAAIDRDREQRARMAEIAILRNRYESLTPREREVLTLVVAGLRNKQIASRLGTSEITVKAHRHQVMHKLKANTVVDLVRTFQRLGGLTSGH
jgi:RNA polymerase sigma factor (sigma-70 family)